MYISGIDYESLADGVGMRTAIYVSGCSHKCKGCHNPDTHNPSYGKELTKDLENIIISNILERPFVTGVTFTGGDPLYISNRASTLRLMKSIIDKVKPYRDDFNVWLYTGYTWEELISMNDSVINDILKCVDVIVDGRFNLDSADRSLQFRGSKNQRIISVRDSLNNGKVVLFEL